MVKEWKAIIPGICIRLHISDVPVLSCTDSEKEWGKVVDEKRSLAQEPCRILSLCHVKSSRMYHKCLPTELHAELNEFIYEKLCDGKVLYHRS
jgi:hypothetical protein